MTAGITRLGISALLDVTRPSLPGLVLNVLIYFALGLAMLGQIQYARLSHRWRQEGIEVPRGLSAHWVRYSLPFLALTGLIAFLLPTGYTLPLLDVITVVLSTLFYVFNLIFQLALLLMMLLIMPMAMLLGIRLDLDPKVPQVEEELDRLTETFLEACYSTHSIEPEQERGGRAAWKRVRTALRSLRRRREEGKDRLEGGVEG